MKQLHISFFVSLLLMFNCSLPSMAGGKADELKDYVTNALQTWKQRGEFEKTSDWLERTNEENQQHIAVAFANAKVNEWLENGTLFIELSRYDVNNETFVLKSDVFGAFVIHVTPEQAQLFKSHWNSFYKQVNYTYDGGLRVKSFTFVPKANEMMVCEVNEGLRYDGTDVNVNSSESSLLALDIVKNDGYFQSKAEKNKDVRPIMPADVDVSIPVVKNSSGDVPTFVVIIGNENYKYVSDVPFAKNDALIFSKYCNMTLGFLEKNVKTYYDATFGEMNKAIRYLTDVAETYHGKVNIIFYYSGHGFPDERTKGAFLLPTDADASMSDVCYPVNDLYNELGKTNAQVLVILDACFSGVRRDVKDELLANVKGVLGIKAKDADLKGNMVVISAASGIETAYPFVEKNHGMLTYFLLKKLQESRGDASLGEIFQYIYDEVRKESVTSIGKSQTPMIGLSPSMETNDAWQKLKMK